MLRRPLLRSRPSPWSVLVPVVALAAGLLFATSGRTAAGNDLRGGEVSELTALVAERDGDVARLEDQLNELRAQAQELTEHAASRNAAVAATQRAGEVGALSAAVVALVGPGVEIVLDDAAQGIDGARPVDASPDDLVIHQSDVQAVVNALWAAGADGVSIMGRRLIATSAVICVGNTLLLQGRTYSPPFVIEAVVDADAVRAELAASPQVAVLQQAVADFGLTFTVEPRPEVELPAYDGPLDMEYATAG